MPEDKTLQRLSCFFIPNNQMRFNPLLQLSLNSSLQKWKLIKNLKLRFQYKKCFCFLGIFYFSIHTVAVPYKFNDDYTFLFLTPVLEEIMWVITLSLHIKNCNAAA
jgi:hypothetical protein